MANSTCQPQHVVGLIQCARQGVAEARGMQRTALAESTYQPRRVVRLTHCA